MAKRKRIKALPVCSEKLREKCEAFQSCGLQHIYSGCSGKILDCPAVKSQRVEKLNVKMCGCALFIYSTKGCPYFRKAGDK